MLSLVPNFLIIVFAIFANGLFVAAEFSLARCRRSKIETLAHGEKDILHSLLLKAIKRLNDYISSAQIGITIASIIVGASAEPFFAILFSPLLSLIHVEESILHVITFTISIFCATFFHVILGEFIPKTLAIQKPERIALITIIPLHAIYILTKPIVWVLNAIASSFFKLFNMNILLNETDFSYTEEEIMYLIEMGEKKGIIEKEEKELVDNVFDFTDTVVREVMTPRTEIIGIEAGSSLKEASLKSVSEKVSKIPVYVENLDEIIGIVHSTDLLKEMYSGNENANLRDVMRSVLKVPENKSLSDLLAEFKKGKIQIAIVIDEFGGTSGLVTLEDIIEELVGDIKDEDEDEAIETLKQLSEDEWLVDASVSIDEINDLLDSNFSNEHFDTIGGFVFGLIGREPEEGDFANFDDWTFVVKKIDKRIEQLHIKRQEKSEDKDSKTEDNSVELLETSNTNTELN